MALPSGGKVIGCDVSTEYVNIGKPFFAEVTSFKPTYASFNLSTITRFSYFIPKPHHIRMFLLQAAVEDKIELHIQPALKTLGLFLNRITN